MARQQMTIAQILEIVRETPDRLASLTEGLSEAQLHAAPEAGEWSVTEILAHLRACSDVWGDAIESIMHSDDPTIRAVNPVTWITRTDYCELAFAPSLRAFTEQRAQLLSLLVPLPAASWSRAATVLGGGAPLELTVQSYATRLARHERTHWRQVAETAAVVRRR